MDGRLSLARYCAIRTRTGVEQHTGPTTSLCEREDTYENWCQNQMANYGGNEEIKRGRGHSSENLRVKLPEYYVKKDSQVYVGHISEQANGWAERLSALVKRLDR